MTKRLFILVPLFLLASCGQSEASKSIDSEAKDLNYYYEHSLNVKYEAAQIPHYSIIDYDDEYVDISFSKSRFFNAENEEITEKYTFKDQEVFKMYSETWFASEPREFWALYVFVK